jgi:hypothetical protein
MKNYFTTLLIIVISGIIFTVYYLLKHMIRQQRVRRNSRHIWHKLYVDEIALIENRLRSAFMKLERQKIQWIICFSRNYPEIKFQFIYSVTAKELQMDVSGVSFDASAWNASKIITGISYKKSEDGISFRLPVNAKIGVDLITRCFYIATGQTRLLNLSIKTSEV